MPTNTAPKTLVLSVIMLCIHSGTRLTVHEIEDVFDYADDVLGYQTVSHVGCS